MSELTKEYFDRQVQNLVTKTVLEESFEKRAVLINRAFQEQKDHFDNEIKRLEDKIDALSAKLTAHLELSDKRYL